MFKRVLVPLDTTPLSDRVLRAGFTLTAADGELVALRIQDEGVELEDNDASRTDLDVVEHETEAVDARIKAAAEAVGFTASWRAEVRSGPVETVILNAAEDLDVDCIVMGTHGRKNIAEMFTGSITERIVNKAPASVFCVKAEGYPFLKE